jgi:hypothetical protein
MPKLPRLTAAKADALLLKAGFRVEQACGPALLRYELQTDGILKRESDGRFHRNPHLTFASDR